jgi:hypothetical protein
VGHIDPMWRTQERRGVRQQARARSTRRWRSPRACWPVPGVSITLSRFEWLEGNAQGVDFRCERLPWHAQLGRRAGWA